MPAVLFVRPDRTGRVRAHAKRDTLTARTRWISLKQTEENVDGEDGGEDPGGRTDGEKKVRRGAGGKKEKELGNCRVIGSFRQSVVGEGKKNLAIP